MSRRLNYLLIGAMVVAVGCSDEPKQTPEATPPVAEATPSVAETSPSVAEAPATAQEPDLEAMAKATTEVAAPALEGSPVEVNAELATRGQAVFAGNCTACHNPNPSLEGALGPAITGSSLELITARVLHAKYPEGYTPKRDTVIMLALPYLEPELPAIHAFLNSKK